VFPQTREQRCWWAHKIGNVLNALPKSAQPGAKAAPAEIYNADREHALAAVKAFRADYGAKWPKAVAKIIDDVDVLLAF
jgi:putative transposase